MSCPSSVVPVLKDCLLTDFLTIRLGTLRQTFQFIWLGSSEPLLNQRLYVYRCSTKGLQQGGGNEVGWFPLLRYQGTFLLK